MRSARAWICWPRSAASSADAPAQLVREPPCPVVTLLLETVDPPRQLLEPFARIGDRRAGRELVDLGTDSGDDFLQRVGVRPPLQIGSEAGDPLLECRKCVEPALRTGQPGSERAGPIVQVARHAFPDAVLQSPEGLDRGLECGEPGPGRERVSDPHGLEAVDRVAETCDRSLERPEAVDACTELFHALLQGLILGRTGSELVEACPQLHQLVLAGHCRGDLLDTGEERLCERLALDDRALGDAPHLLAKLRGRRLGGERRSHELLFQLRHPRLQRADQLVVAGPRRELSTRPRISSSAPCLARAPPPPQARRVATGVRRERQCRAPVPRSSSPAHPQASPRGRGSSGAKPWRARPLPRARPGARAVRRPAPCRAVVSRARRCEREARRGVRDPAHARPGAPTHRPAPEARPPRAGQALARQRPRASSIFARSSSTALRSARVPPAPPTRRPAPEARRPERDRLTPGQHRQLLDPRPQLVHRTQIRLPHGDSSKLVDPSAKLVDRTRSGSRPASTRQLLDPRPQLFHRTQVGLLHGEQATRRPAPEARRSERDRAHARPAAPAPRPAPAAPPPHSDPAPARRAARTPRPAPEAPRPE